MIATNQGLICPFIVVAEENVADPGRDVLGAVSDFAYFAEAEAWLQTGEYPAEAQWANAMGYYIMQVENGGHGQFAANSGLNPRTLAGVRQVLERTDFPDLRAIFDEFTSLMAAPEMAQLAMDTGGFEGTPSAIEALDRRFHKLGGDAVRIQAGSWLRTLPALKTVPGRELKAELEIIKARNPLLQERRTAAEARRAELHAADGRYIAAKALCEAAGLQFQGFIAGVPRKAPEIMLWSMRTPVGTRSLLFQLGRVELLDGAIRPMGFSCAWPIALNSRVIVARQRQPFLSRVLFWVRSRFGGQG